MSTQKALIIDGPFINDTRPVPWPWENKSTVMQVVRPELGSSSAAGRRISQVAVPKTDYTVREFSLDGKIYLIASKAEHNEDYIISMIKTNDHQPIPD
ncbi:hypothetical protein BS639_24060 [Rouxiella silvae]|jgi:hypothetical protein|uniref:Head-tail adaptor protein n=1 Tax=Rouxiella silvae TaxID=1646373 RepID=A0ABX3TTX5_9GAMM|nr:hypothetical protein [Rouxiella silvae]ORJ18659.1 hypothetical protein BS639_24060 [Rouxiella silvae]